MKGVCAVVLIKDFETAKSRLAPDLAPAARYALARANALKALEAARAADVVLAVAGSAEAARMASATGAAVLVEAAPAGQNAAAAAGLEWARGHGLQEALVLSSDLPLVTADAIAAMLAVGREMSPPAALAAAATGRGGTNALYLHPLDGLGLFFGEDSLVRFEAEALARNVSFAIHESPRLALDLDEPGDLARLRVLPARA